MTLQPFRVLIKGIFVIMQLLQDSRQIRNNLFYHCGKTILSIQCSVCKVKPVISIVTKQCF